jgi:hypothetical protein
MLVGWQLLDELKGDEELRRALIEEILADMLGRKEWRKAALLAVVKEAATKDDIRELRAYVDTRLDDLNNNLNRRIDDLNRRIDDMNRGLDRLHGIVRASLVAIAVTLASTILVPLILRMLLGA